MTQEQVSHGAGMHNTQYNGYETGRSRPNQETLARIAASIGIDLETLMSANVDESESDRGDSIEAPMSWDQARNVLQALTARRLGVDETRVTIEVKVT